jgi:molybdopterin converting factor small subunit
MIQLVLPASLCVLVPETENDSEARRSVTLSADSWDGVVQELRERCPQLAERVLTQSGAVAAGFVLVVNGVTVPSSQRSVELKPGDEIFLLAQISGG